MIVTYWQTITCALIAPTGDPVTTFALRGATDTSAWTRALAWLHATQGTLEAVIAWDGGAHVTHLRVQDGDVQVRTTDLITLVLHADAMDQTTKDDE